MSFALFAAGMATFALLYSTQALLPAVSADFGVSASAASWTVSAATAALAVFVLPMSSLSERFGRRPVMTASLAVAVAVGLLVPFAPSLEWLVALRAVQGAALAGLPASAMAYLAEEVRPKALVAAIGLFVAGNSIGGMSGRIVTGWVAQLWGWRAALAAVGLMALVCALVFRAMLPKARHFRPGSVNPRALVATVRGHLADPLLLRLYAIGALFMTVFGAVYTVIGYRLVEAPSACRRASSARSSWCTSSVRSPPPPPGSWSAVSAAAEPCTSRSPRPPPACCCHWRTRCPRCCWAWC